MPGGEKTILGVLFGRIAGGITILVISFFGTLWIIDNVMQKPAETIDRIAASNEREFTQAAERLGYRKSVRITGAPNGLSRVTGGRLKTTGWATNLDGDGTPLTVLGFAAGHSVMRVKTAGARQDVTEYLKLPPSSPVTRNVGFEGLPTECEVGQPLIYIAVQEESKLFGTVGQWPCPPK